MSKNTKDEFQYMCNKYFHFLEDDFNCKSIYKRSGIGYSIIYRNSTTGVSINYGPRDGGIIYVLIMRIINNRIPDYSIDIEDDSPLNIFDLEDLIAFRSPALKVERPSNEQLLKPFSVNIFEETLMQLAKALELYAQDILKGDFKVFSELEKIVKMRAKEFSQDKK